MRETAVIRVGGEPVELLPERAAWWPGERTLVVADLHLGKEHAFAAAGIGLPPNILDETLDRLARCIGLTGAERVVIAGDLLHAKVGTTERLIERVSAWRRTVAAELLLVPGNHDRAADQVVGAWGIEHRGPDLRLGPFRFVHEPDGGVPDAFTWAGHLHPAVRLVAGRDSVRLPCFCVGERVGILPAFTRFSGRTTPVLALSDRAWAIADDRVILAPTRVVCGG
jgi:DNA ligase-associated metallophosphoesterase